jgi:hypothetical protein
MDYHGNAMYKEYAFSIFIDVTDSMNFQTPCGYGATIGDINNDGWFDMFITNWHNYTDNLFLRDSTAGFIDVTNSWGAFGNDWTSAAHLADFDNDGWLDLYVSGAGTGNKYYRNEFGTCFIDETEESGMTNYAYNWGASVGDYNNDGFLDIYVPEYFYSGNGGRLYRNNGNSNNWIKFKLSGQISNRDGIGARLFLASPSTRQTSQVIAGSGFGSQNSLIQHFGLGQDAIVSTLTIVWPSGRTDQFEMIPAGNSYIVEEGSGIVNIEDDSIILPSDFRISNIYPNPFNNMARIQVEVTKEMNLTIDIIDILGREIKLLHTGRIDPGTKSIIWDGTDEQGSQVSSGTYFCRVRSLDRVISERLSLVK